MLTTKKAVYDVLDKLNVPVYDTPQNLSTFPYILLTMSNDIGTDYKNSNQEDIYFTINIFSEYKGEKEIITLADTITTEMRTLYLLPEVIYVKKEQFLIINDTNPLVKHGILIYRIRTMEV